MLGVALRLGASPAAACSDEGAAGQSRGAGVPAAAAAAADDDDDRGLR